MGLDKITPVVLTLNEEPNVARTLATLRWADRVVVVDSGSTDATRSLAMSFPNVAWYERTFDGYGRQWSFAIGETGIATPYVLALDADMPVPADTRDELAALASRDDLAGVVVPFQYCIAGRPLLGSVYPAQLRLLRVGRVAVGEEGHKHMFRANGPVAQARSRLLHDDRKSLERFVASQLAYSMIEAQRLSAGRSTGWKSWLRRNLPGWPALVSLFAYFRAGGPICGAASERYALERLLFESLLRFRLTEIRLDQKIPAKSGAGDGASQ